MPKLCLAWATHCLLSANRVPGCGVRFRRECPRWFPEQSQICTRHYCRDIIPCFHRAVNPLNSQFVLQTVFIVGKRTCAGSSPEPFEPPRTPRSPELIVSPSPHPVTKVGRQVKVKPAGAFEQWNSRCKTGLINMRSIFREPGFTWKLDIPCWILSVHGLRNQDQYPTANTERPNLKADEDPDED